MIFRTTIIFLLMALLLQGCISTNRITTVNYQQNYTMANEKAPFRHVLIHQNDSLSTLIYEVDYSGLTYKKEKAGGNYLAKYRVAFQVYPEIKSNKISDSASYYFSDSLHFATYKKETGQVPVKLQNASSAFLNIEFKDLQSGKPYRYFLEVHKSDSDKHNFLVKNSSGAIHFPDYKRYYDKYRFEYRGESQHPLSATLYQNNKKAIALPPFTMLQPDYPPIITKKNLEAVQGVINLQGETGLLVVKNKNASVGGHPFLSSYLTFPENPGYDKKIETLRYITTNEEFLALSARKDPEKAYTDFWRKATGDYDRAYSKMELYEERVRRANTFFTIVNEGWKSDRGMIYIIFGVPTSVLKYEGQEKWLYQPQGNRLEFIFKLKDSPYGVKEYYLERKEAYRIPWYSKVENWKN